MKTLYISDLDGTLLNGGAELSEYTAGALRKLIEGGVHFTIATARTTATVEHILERVPVNVPAILMNGVLIYDMRKRIYLKKNPLPDDAVETVLAAIKSTGQAGLMYAIRDEKLITYYERLDDGPLRDFVAERVKKYNKTFTKTNEFSKTGADVIYFAFLESHDRIQRLRGLVKDIAGLDTVMYKDIYSGDLWYLECYSSAASKFNGVNYLRREYGYGRIVGFGDNLNDIPLFEACDECLAVENAKPELKEKADAVIGSNIDDGVARWLLKNAPAGQPDMQR
ncbi:MAG: HAD-IIB family hydrolase [Clostridia bacterium]|nr:HAD-IIB family hydrolase [Clostridia bacterium]